MDHAHSRTYRTRPEASAVGGLKRHVSMRASGFGTQARLAARLRLSDLLVDVSSRLFRSDEEAFDAAIDAALGAVGAFVGVDRAYLFLFEDGASRMSNTHEWCATGVTPERDNLQALPTSMFPEWTRRLLAGHDIYIADVAGLPDDWRAEREILEPQGVQSLLVVPVTAGREVLGFMGYDAVRTRVRWAAEARRLLAFLADNVGVMVRRRREREALRVATERARDLAQQAEAASRAKSEFLATMSHEIRTPMNGVIGMTRLLRDTGMSERQRKYVDTLRASAEALLGVIDDVLDFSKIEAGKVELERIPFSLEEVLLRAAEVFSPSAQDKGLELNVGLDPRAPALVSGDPTRVTQLLNNLLSNAIKFTERGAVTATLSVRGVSDGVASVTLGVEDTGIGLDPSDLARIFEAFGQADTSTTRRYGGTGLGLTITRDLCRLMGGDIAVRSARGRGTVFELYLAFPIVDAPSSAPPAGWPGRSALVVDDHAAARDIIAALLASWGFAVTAVSSGAEALAALDEAVRAERPFAVALVDWQMPGIDGLETIRRARLALAVPPPFLLVTAYEPAELGDAGGGAGFAGLVSKPIRPQVLQQRLRAALDGRAPAPDADEEAVVDRFDGARVLVVDDHEINRVVARDLLARLGVEVVLACDGREGVDRVAADRFDLVLMDLQMPGLDGFAATRALRERERGAGHRLPVVAMTAHALHSDRERVIAADLDDHLAKPLDADAVARLLARWLPRLHRRVEAPATSAAPLPTAVARVAERLPQLDTRAGLQRVAGNADLYTTLLRRFAADAAAEAAALARLRRDGAWGDASCALHGLRGSVAALGHASLAAVFAEAEWACAGPRAAVERAPERLVERAEVALARFAAELSAALGPAPGADVGAGTVTATLAEVGPWLALLRDAAQDGDVMAARGALRGLGRFVASEAAQRRFEALATCVQRYRLDEVPEHVDLWMGELESPGGGSHG